MSLPVGGLDPAAGHARRAVHVRAPLTLDLHGRTGLCDEETYVRGLVEQVLFTRPGERVRRPDFGSGVDALVFAPSGDELADTTRALVQGALQRFLGDLLRIEEVVVTAVDSRLEVTVRYRPLGVPASAPSRTVSLGTGGPGRVGAP